MFKAIRIERDEGGQRAELCTLREQDLPQSDVLVKTEYSTLNYKDGLTITGALPLIQSFPMVPGIDLAGVVEDSSDPRWQPGDRVVANGWGLGEQHWGGLSQYARLKGDWLVRIPDAFTTRQAMAIGTAGYTAMLCVLRLERLGVRPEEGKVLVTGASGGVGSIAIALLHKLGYEVVASTGRRSEAEYLRHMGATEIIDRAELNTSGAPLQEPRWRAAIDTVGSQTLVNVLARMSYGGVVAATGIAQGIDLPGTMFPFALRDVTLSGVDSVMQPRATREEAWRRLAGDLDPAKLESAISEVKLSEVLELAPRILQGQIRGRTVVDVRRVS